MNWDRLDPYRFTRGEFTRGEFDEYVKLCRLVRAADQFSPTGLFFRNDVGVTMRIREVSDDMVVWVGMGARSAAGIGQMKAASNMCLGTMKLDPEFRMVVEWPA